MPIYEYDCRRCGKRFEVFARSFSSNGSPKCPKCGCKRTDKALSVFSAGGGARAEGGSGSGSSGSSCGRCGRSSCAGCHH